ncbi:MAG: Ig-like domain-containing protein [Anaerolineae bacterium]
MVQRKWLFASIGLAAVVALTVAGSLYYWLVLRDTKPPAPPSVIAPGGTVVSEYDPAQPLVLTFTEPMDKESIADAVQVQPPVPFVLEWRDDRSVEVQFQQLDRENTYEVTVGAGAKGSNGLDLRDAVTITLRTAGNLAVSDVQPADGADAVALDSTITVVFNRPVVDLSSELDQRQLPQPLVITPTVPGSGEWINTSIYRFTPTSTLAPLTEYSVAVDGSLVDGSGAGLAEPFGWSFTTVSPQVLSYTPAPSPGEGESPTYARPTDPIRIDFAQPMDQASVEAVLKVRTNSLGGADVAGRIRWAANSLIFTPSQPWQRGAAIAVDLSGAEAEGGAELPALTWTFHVIERLRLVSTEPANDSAYVDPGMSVRLLFSAPIDFESLEANLTIEPKPDYVYTYWDSDSSAYLNFQQDAATEYTVTVGAGVTDISGWKLGQDVSFSFTTGDWSPSFTLLDSWHPWAFGSTDEPMAYASYRNVTRLDFILYSLSEDAFIRLSGDDWQFQQDFRPSGRDVIRTWSEESAAARNEWGTTVSPLAEDGGTLPTGLYYLVVTAPEFPNPDVWQMSRQVIVVTGQNVTMKWSRGQAMAWVTGWDDGEPRADVPVRFVDADGGEITAGSTGSDGIFIDEIPDQEAWRTYFAFAGTAGESDFAVATTGWSDGINPWRYDVSLSGYSAPYTVYLYTDRAIYRPGQTVYYKGIIRYDQDARYSVPSDMPPLQLTCTDAQGQEILSQPVTLNEMGTFNGSLTLAEGAPLGYYNFWMPLDPEMGYGSGASFQVAEYRRPEYEISVVTDRDEYMQGDTVGVTAQASYYFGGPVSEAAVRWTVLTQDYFFNWQGEGYYDFTDYDYLRERQYFGPYGEAVAEGEGTTDSSGRFAFTFPADIADKAVSQQLTIEVTVTDVNSQEVSARTSVLVHKGSFYIGVRPQSYVSTAGEETLVDVITVDSQSQPVAGRDVAVTFFEHRWYNVRERVDGSYQWSTSVEDVEVASVDVTTDAEGRAEAGFLPESPGTYRVVAIATDDQGNEIRSSTYLWVTGQGYVSWAMQEDYTVQLITDKKSYRVGDTARVLIPSPYQGSVAALITSERGQVLDYRVINVESSSQVVEIPITEEFAPNVYFVAVLMRGADEDAALPPFQIGFASAEVAIDALQIALDVEPNSTETYQPGDEAVFNITARDVEGNPVQAEMSLELVDKSVLALAESTQQSLVDYFYSKRSLGVQTTLTMAISTEDLEEGLPAQGKGGGGGGEPGGVVREDFPETAFWEPTLRTDADGRATVAVTLPDNLTTWRLQAKAVTADTLVAEEEVDIVSTKELLLTPILPRFLVSGDTAMVGAVVHNNSGQSLTAQVSLAAEGLATQAEPQSVTIAAGGRTTVTWEVTAVNVGDASITVSTTAEQYSDAVKQSLPVYGMTVAEVVATSGQVGPGETIVEGVAAPPRYGDGELTVEVDATLAAGMIPGLTYLEHYPYECVEQTLSRFLPNVVTSRALRQLGLENADLTQNLAEQVAVGLQKLYGNQHVDGGWGWWYADDSNPFLSAYVVYGLAQARDAGYSVDEGVFDRAVAFLVDSLHRRASGEGVPVVSSDDRAYIVYVLAEAGEGDLGASVSVYENRTELTNRGKAYLLMALAILSPQEQSRLDALMADLKATAVIAATSTYWQDPAEWKSMGTDVVTTAVVVQALSRVAPEEALLPGAVRWLMAARQEGHWRSTYETATTIMALTDYMVASGELQANYAWSVAINGRQEAEGTYSADNLTEQQTLQVAIADLLRDQSNSVSFARTAAAGSDTDTGEMYYSMSLRYYPPVEELRAVNGGIIVEREYRAVTDSRQRVTAAAANDMVEVKLTIVAPNDLYHVVVEDPFPAGCEGVDTSLLTTTVVGVQPEQTAKDEPWGWWWFSHSEIRDDKAVLFATYLPKGTYEYVYYIRASVPGEYNVRPALAYQMYFPDVYGHGGGSHFTVTAAQP